MGSMWSHHAEDALPRQHLAAQHTFHVALDFIRTVVFTVVEVVAAKDGADATPIGALELILLAYGRGWRHFLEK